MLERRRQILRKELNIHFSSSLNSLSLFLFLVGQKKRRCFLSFRVIRIKLIIINPTVIKPIINPTTITIGDRWRKGGRKGLGRRKEGGGSWEEVGRRRGWRRKGGERTFSTIVIINITITITVTTSFLPLPSLFVLLLFLFELDIIPLTIIASNWFNRKWLGKPTTSEIRMNIQPTRG